MSRILFRAAMLVMVLLGALGIWWLTRPDPVAVSVHVIARGRVESLVANTRVGTVKACRRAQLSPATGGQVSRLLVSEGDSVAQGALLMEIWNADLKAQRILMEREAATAKERALEACTSARGDAREAARLTGLKKRRLVSDEVADVAHTRAEAQQAQCAAAHSNIAVADARITVAAQALVRTLLHAPFAGVVAEVNAELGEYMTPSPPGILTLPAVDLIDIGCLFVSAPIDEVDAPAIRLGQTACVTLDAFPEPRCSGVVRRIAPYVLDLEKQARTVEIEVELLDPLERRDLLPGYSADIEVKLDVHEDVLRVPSEAILDGHTVLLYDPHNHHLITRRFSPGLANWRFTEVLEGLVAGDLVVLSIGREGVVAGAYARAETVTDPH